VKVWVQKVGDDGEEEEEGGEKKSHRVEDQCEFLEKPVFLTLSQQDLGLIEPSFFKGHWFKKF
jgi:hypothetical protein